MLWEYLYLISYSYNNLPHLESNSWMNCICCLRMLPYNAVEYTVLHIYIYISSSSSSCRAISRDIPDPLLPPSLSSIDSSRSSGLHPISTQSCCIMFKLVALPLLGHVKGSKRVISLMSRSLLLLQYPDCLVRLILIFIVMGGWWLTAVALWGVASRTCSILLAAFLRNRRQAFSWSV